MLYGVSALALAAQRHGPDGTPMRFVLGSRAPPRGGAEADFQGALSILLLTMINIGPVSELPPPQRDVESLPFYDEIPSSGVVRGAQTIDCDYILLL
jgi:hypothetical protein